MPLTSKGTEIMHNMKSEYGAKKGERVFYATKNAGKINGVDARRFRDALRRGLSLDAAFGYAAAEEAERAGQGNPLDQRLVKQCIRDSATEGGSVHDVLKRAVDSRISFRGSKDAAPKPTSTPNATPKPAATPVNNTHKPTEPEAGVGAAAREAGGAAVTGIHKAGELAESAGGSVESARAMRHPQGRDAAAPGHNCSPENCYPGCGHLCMQGRGVMDGLKRRRGLSADDCPPGEGEVGTPSYAWKSANNTTAAADELFAAQPDDSTRRLLLGDRGKTDHLMAGSTIDAWINKIKGRRLGNLKKPMNRDSMEESMMGGEVEDGATPWTRHNRDSTGAFERVERSVAAKGAHDPKALAAWIGRCAARVRPSSKPRPPRRARRRPVRRITSDSTMMTSA